MLRFPEPAYFLNALCSTQERHARSRPEDECDRGFRRPGDRRIGRLREAGSRIASEGMPAFCAVLRSLFAGKSGEMRGLVFH